MIRIWLDLISPFHPPDPLRQMEVSVCCVWIQCEVTGVRWRRRQGFLGLRYSRFFIGWSFELIECVSVGVFVCDDSLLLLLLLSGHRQKSQPSSTRNVTCCPAYDWDYYLGCLIKCRTDEWQREGELCAHTYALCMTPCKKYWISWISLIYLSTHQR